MKKSGNPVWTRVAKQAGWRPRDSQGGVVYKELMWILGGWFSNEEACPCDVWNSRDGKRWELITKAAPWKHGDLPVTLVFKDMIWLMGGWYNGLLADNSASSEVWYYDGIQWSRATQCAGWTPRLGAASVSFKDKMWILGGIEDYKMWIYSLEGNNGSAHKNCLKNDVWCSEDGRNWELVVNDAGWSPRAFHQAAVFRDKIWILGGGSYDSEIQMLNDVWCSEDGINWICIDRKMPWGKRIWFPVVVYRDHIWVLGGFSCDSNLDQHINYNDVWFSRDGAKWDQFMSDDIWTARHAHSAFVFRDKLWIAGGKCDVLLPNSPDAGIRHAKALMNDVWSLYIPENWFGEE